MDEAAREYNRRTGSWSWSATSWDGLSGGADNCAGARGDEAADAIPSGRDPWSRDESFESSDVGNRILRQRMREIERGIHKTNIVRTSHSSSTFGDKATEDSRGGEPGSGLCARCRSFGAGAVTSEACVEVTSNQL